MLPKDDKTGEAANTTVRRMSSADLPAVLSILKESPEASIWSAESLWESASRGVAWVAERNGRVVGMLVGRPAADEFEILNMAVATEFRRQGVATHLVTAALEFAMTAGARQTHLEVRASNEAGIVFYTRLGFRACGRRPAYYRRPVEDAVLLILYNREIKR